MSYNFQQPYSPFSFVKKDNFNKNPVLNISIMEVTIIDAGTYERQFFRPYESCLDINNLDSVVDKVYSTNNNNNSNSVLNNVNFVSYRTSPESEITIPNGWSTPRFKMLLKIEVKYRVGGCHRYLIQAYSEYTDSSIYGRIDPRMNWFINSITDLVDSGGYSRINSISHILSDNQSSAVNPTYGMRPTDVLATMQHPIYDESYETLYDTRIVLTTQPKASSFYNTDPKNFFKTMVDSYYSGAMQTTQLTENEIINNAVSMSSNMEANISTNPFFLAMSNIQGLSTNVPSSFTLSDLNLLDPTMDEKVNMIVADSSTPQMGQSHGWMGTDRYTHWANFIARTVGPVLSKMGIFSASFSATNYSPLYDQPISFFDMKFFDGVLPGNFQLVASLAKNHLWKDVFNSVSYENQMLFSCMVSYNQFGATTIDLSFENEPAIRFTAPTFADAMLAPIVTKSRENTVALSNDLSNIFNSFNEARTSIQY